MDAAVQLFTSQGNDATTIFVARVYQTRSTKHSALPSFPYILKSAFVFQ